MAAVGGPEARKSSLFEVQKANPVNLDLGTSSLSLSDDPSISKRGMKEKSNSIIIIRRFFFQWSLKNFEFRILYFFQNDMYLHFKNSQCSIKIALKREGRHYKLFVMLSLPIYGNSRRLYHNQLKIQKGIKNR